MSEFKPIIEQSFIQYAGAVLQSRALIDVRDALKPSARQIFYALYTDKFLYNKPYKKTLKAIGSLSRFYIHGDASAVGVLMRAGQNFSMRYPLIDVKGNAGTLIASGNWASQRYTESRLSEISSMIFKDIDKDTIKEWRDNYDDTEQYPAVLPSKGFYNIVNGTSGIGIGMASSIPQYNLKEVNEALIKLLWNPDIDFEEIFCSPDFATGATLLNENEVKESMKNGNGKACKLRATIEFDSKERCLIATEIPYGVYTNTICGELEKILNDEANPGIERFNDLTGKTPLIKIYLSKKANVDKVIKYLYKNTSLQSHFSINFTMLDNGRFPKVFTWKEALQAHIDHEKEVYRRGYEFDMKKIKARLHIIEGLLKAISNIDEVIKIVKSSASTAEANKSLQNFLQIDEEQAKAILDIKLARLAKLEVNKLQDERVKLEGQLRVIIEILEDEVKFKTEIEKGFKEVAEKYGDGRRTKILNIEADEDEEPVEVKSLQISLTNKDNIYITETSSLYVQRRGGVGNKMKLDKNEYVCENLTIESTDTILFFTNKGNLYPYQVSAIPIEEKIPVECLFCLKDAESIKTFSTYNRYTEKKNIVFITKQGYIKKSLFSEYNTKRTIGIKALTLPEDDEIVQVLIMDDERLGILAEDGNFIIIETKDIRPIGRVARGIRGIKLNENVAVAAAHIVPTTTKEIVSVTESGMAKRTPYNEFSIQGKNTKGTKLHKLNEEKIVDFAAIDNESDILVVSSSACIRIKISDFPLQSKGTQGIHSIKLKEKDKIINISLL